MLTAQSLLVALAWAPPRRVTPDRATKRSEGRRRVVRDPAAGALGGQRYDEDPKRWWALSNLLEDAARALELITPAFPGAFLLAASATFVRAPR